MTDPIEGRFGSLIMSGWIAETPDTGKDGAFMLLTTPDSRASVTMPLVADALGFNPAHGSMTPAPAADTWVEVKDGWATLHIPGGEKFDRPVSAEWAELARKHSRVILVIGYAPSRSDEAADAYVDRAMPTARFSFGITPVR